MSVSRYDVNRDIRNALTRHYVDLVGINFSFIGSTAYLSGILQRDRHNDFTVTEVESILKDLRRINHVRDLQVELENWMVTPEGSGWIIRRRKVADRAPLQDDTVVVKEAESLRTVLDELRQKPPATDGTKKE
jgi:hypothetical protein